MNLLKGSALLKFAALIVALMTYFYIQNEIDTAGKSNSADSSYKLIKLTAKKLPIKARFEAAPPPGYRIHEDQVLISPAQVTVIGPEALFEDAMNAETSTLDISEYTKQVTKQVPLESVAGVHLVGEPYLVDVTVPIEKIPTPVEKPASPQPAVVSEAPAEPAAATTT